MLSGWKQDLQYLQIESISREECVKRLKTAKAKDENGKIREMHKFVNKRNLCTKQAPGTDSCQGDSGGPLYLHEGKKKGTWVK